MKKLILCNSLVAGLLALTFQACTTTTQKEIDAKVKAEPAVVHRKDLIAEGEMLIEKSPNLTDAQRTKLRQLWHDSKAQSDDLVTKSLQLRAVLIKDLVATPYDDREVNVVKTKLSKVEQDRLAVFLKGVRETNRILGRWGSADERNNFYQWFTIDPSSTSF